MFLVNLSSDSRRGIIPAGTLLAIDAPGESFTGQLVHDCDDLDGTFVVRDIDEGDLLRVNGWNCSIEILDQLGVDRE